MDKLDAVDVPERIEVDGGTDVVLTWADGAETRLSATELRAACRCASCREPDGIERTAAVVGGPVPVTIAEAKLVGGYAVNFVFAPEGHGTGIYPFTALRELGEAGAPSSHPDPRIAGGGLPEDARRPDRPAAVHDPAAGDESPGGSTPR